MSTIPKILLSFLFFALILSSFNHSVAQRSGDGFRRQDWLTGGRVSFTKNLISLEGAAGSIRHKATHQDFQLQLELRTVRAGKGYVSIHTDSGGKGYRIALDNDPNNAEWWKKTGSLLSVRNLTKSLVKDNEWFQLSVQVQGRRISVQVNGQPVVDYVEPTQPYRSAPNLQALLSTGAIGVNATAGGIEIRKFTVAGLNRASADQTALSVDEQTDAIIRLHQEDFPVLDYHVHLKGALTWNAAAAQSRKIGINYAVAPNVGVGFPIHDDQGIYRYLDTLKNAPFILPMQAEGREWVTAFSRQALDRFDFLFTDAETFTDLKGRRTRLWIENEVFIDDEQQYMDLIVEKIIGVLQEPVDVYVNPFFLPKVMQPRFDELWTPERRTKVITALAKSGKAMEINNRYRIPSKKIILEAKAAGIKFTFGTNNVTADLGKLDYCLQMKEECKIQAKEMYKPGIVN